jgi:hypothetical protein
MIVYINYKVSMNKYSETNAHRQRHNMTPKNNSNNNNIIRVYLRANLTAQRPITKLIWVHRNTEITKKQDTNKTVYIMAIN